MNSDVINNQLSKKEQVARGFSEWSCVSAFWQVQKSKNLFSLLAKQLDTMDFGITILYASETGTAQDVAEQIWKSAKRFCCLSSVI